MKKIKLDLEHCYGIKRLKATLTFGKPAVICIYAPNGAMKSSLATTFLDIAQGSPSSDRMFPDRKTTRSATDESNNEIPADQILVVKPYDEVLGTNAKTSTLLINAALRKEYEQLHSDIDKARDQLVAALKATAKTKKDIKAEISATFTPAADQFDSAIQRIINEVKGLKNPPPFTDLPYDLLFDDKVTGFLETKDFRTAINDYTIKLNQLLDKSEYFSRATFSYYNASVIAKTLSDNGFFDAKHTVNLNAANKIEIKDQSGLEELILNEKNNITKDPALKKKYDELEKLITKNATLRDFEAYLSEHEELLPALANPKQLKEDVWKSYLHQNLSLASTLSQTISDAEARKSQIVALAEKEQTDWEAVIEEFNTRFFVPFKLKAENRTEVLLGQEPILKLGFTFEDAGEAAQVDRNQLLQALSTGEKKALYVLNVIFDVRVRLKSGQHTLIVVDDVADSFDYRNKYAIIQYLKDISDNDCFNQIILTHNFDFFRTLNSRFVPYSSCLMVVKSKDDISLIQAVGIKNVFVNDWKPNFATNARKRIAAIPFMRNLIEFTKGDDDPGYEKLTSLLHWKADTETIKTSELFKLYNALFGTELDAPVGGEDIPVVDAIEAEAKNCLGEAQGANFENKIVLAIAIRLGAERYMSTKIADQEFVGKITKKQTAALLTEFKKRFAADKTAIAVLDRVSLMTPENIHLNSFMYEPILDMSDEHLRQLYTDLRDLDASPQPQDAA